MATGTYLPFAFFNLISPFMSMLFGFMGWKINVRKIKEQTEARSNGNADLKIEV